MVLLELCRMLMLPGIHAKCAYMITSVSDQTMYMTALVSSLLDVISSDMCGCMPTDIDTKNATPVGQ